MEIKPLKVMRRLIFRATNERRPDKQPGSNYSRQRKCAWKAHYLTQCVSTVFVLVEAAGVCVCVCMYISGC